MTEFISRNHGHSCYEIIIKTTNHEHYRMTEDFARRLIDHAKPAADNNVGHWIPVSERLPEDSLPRFSNVKQIKVLTALLGNNGVRTVRSQMRYRDDWVTGNVRWRWKYTGSTITHWMPLPEPPKEDV